MKAVVLDVDSTKERISLGIKQVGGDPMETIGKFKKGDAVTCEVIAVEPNGIQVRLADSDITTYVKRSDLSRDRSEQRPERYNVGDKVDAAIIGLDKNSRRITVSIKALEIAEEKQAVAQYGSTNSGASLGDIFKAALKKRETRKTARSKTSTAVLDTLTAPPSVRCGWRRGQRLPISFLAAVDLNHAVTMRNAT